MRKKQNPNKIKDKYQTMNVKTINNRIIIFNS